MVYRIGILGMGTVGTGTVEILLNPQGRHPLLTEISIKSVGVRSLTKARKVLLPPGTITTNLEAIVTDPDIDIVVELLGGLEPSRSLILQAIASGKHVVTANKAVIARYGDEIYTAANQGNVYVLIEGSVGGGIPVIEPLKRSLVANRIESVIGIINGTTNYILTQMSSAGAQFASVLSQAQALGYAEADPSADVDGFDAADKIAILSSLAFNLRVKRAEIFTEGISSIDTVDINYALKLGFVIKLLAIAQLINPDKPNQLQVRVHPTLVPKDHPLASINGVYNAILIQGDPIGQVMFYGPGAGSGPTASAVVADIMNIVGVLKSNGKTEILDPLLSCSHQDYCDLMSIEELNTRFYVRFLTQDLPGVIGEIGTCFGRHHVSLESIVQIGFQDNLAEIVVITHNVKEGNFRQALKEIEAKPQIKNIPTVLRVL
ncbi:homoserine dehydrogenase [Gloeocapsa sp. PCC 73106]|uniref:homoserine dehydrogenase n=1 Tax=Gloeocapsa sp. PCC 73106 TaxID=102232 RepID=UPI0002ABE9F3|nr:homoserine dehydrogenase [Gloeocapsa sp. PCC 73106]ELR96838.1 homoserine dehydrogenase [Gloeocapsa sp. PCC 73106]